jgi:hypothetical protein
LDTAVGHPGVQPKEGKQPNVPAGLKLRIVFALLPRTGWRPICWSCHTGRSAGSDSTKSMLQPRLTAPSSADSQAGLPEVRSSRKREAAGSRCRRIPISSKGRSPMATTTEGKPTPSAASGSQKHDQTERRRPRVYPNCANAIALLTAHPVFASPVPRFHVQPRLPTGTLIVYDRSSNEHIQVYSPRFAYQFRAGYRAGQWYLRRMHDVATAPRSAGFRTARDAIAALEAGLWRIARPGPHDSQGRTPPRVLWR